MAIYFDGVDKTKCPVRGVAVDDDKVICRFKISSRDDIPNLPLTDKIRGGSSALIMPTKEVVFLDENGWV